MVSKRARAYSIPFLVAGFVSFALGCERSDVVEASSHPTSVNTNGVGQQHVPPAKVQFSKAIFIKPNSDTPESDARMAPLVVLQCNRGEGTDTPIPFCSIAPDENGRLQFDKKRPTVYAFEDEIELNGLVHRRLTHLLFYSSTDHKPKPKHLTYSCIQTTLDVEGAPILWHVYDAGRSELEQAYVSRAVEAASVREFGSPKSVGAFATARPGSQVEVVRVLDDGPEPMGPMVYVTRRPHRVVSVGCRCMASQVDEIERATFYRLVKNPMDIGPDASVLDQVQALFEASRVPWDPKFESFLARRLDKALRLPSNP